MERAVGCIHIATWVESEGSHTLIRMHITSRVHSLLLCQKMSKIGLQGAKICYIMCCESKKKAHVADLYCVLPWDPFVLTFAH